MVIELGKAVEVNKDLVDKLKSLVPPDGKVPNFEKYGDQSGPYTAEEEKAIAELQKLIQDDPDFNQFSKFAYGNMLIVALRACKLDPQMCYKTVRDIYKITTKTYPEVIGKIDLPSIRTLLTKRIFQVVKRPVDKGPAIIVVRVGNWHISDGIAEEVIIAAALYIWAVGRVSREIQQEGIISIADMSGFKLKHARQMNIDLVKMGLKYYTHVSHMISLAKGAFAINSSTLVDETYNLFKPLLPKEIKNLVSISRKDTSAITKAVDPAFLPMEFGGKIPDEEAYYDNIEDEILNDKEMFEWISDMQKQMMEVFGVKKATRKVKKKVKKGKKGEKDEAKVEAKQAEVKDEEEEETDDEDPQVEITSM